MMSLFWVGTLVAHLRVRQSFANSRVRGVVHVCPAHSTGYEVLVYYAFFFPSFSSLFLGTV